MANDTAPIGLADSVMALLAAAIDQRADDLKDTLAEIALRYGDRGLYALTYAMAEIAKRTWFDGTEGLAYIQTRDGQAPEDLPPELRAHLWAARFLVAHLNDDADQRAALWMAEVDINRAVGNVIALIWLTASLVRQRQEAN